MSDSPCGDAPDVVDFVHVRSVTAHRVTSDAKTESINLAGKPYG